MDTRCLGCMQIFDEDFGICPFCGYVPNTQAEEAIHLNPGTILHNRYIVGRVLGYGGFGVTYIGWDGTLEQKVAIKEYFPTEFSTRMLGYSQVTVFNGEKGEQFRDGQKKFVDEAKRLAKFQNEAGIVKIFDSFEENDTAYIIMEYLEGETLTTYLEREGTIQEDKAVAMLLPLMESLETVHNEGILHRDIAPDNIFLTKDGNVKLIDFGASRYATTSHSRSMTVIIKPGYSPEEQYRSRGDQGVYTDVYSLAATLYKMVTGQVPPDAMERRAQFENNGKDILTDPRKINGSISINRQNAILNAMNVRIEDRTPDVKTFIKELTSYSPVARVAGKLKMLDFYTWPIWAKIAIPAVALMAIVFGALVFTGVISTDAYSKEAILPENVILSPYVEGLQYQEALSTIESSGLIAETGGSVTSDYVSAGIIVRQTPVGGTFIEKNGKVVLTVSSGGDIEKSADGVATMPYVTWDKKDDAIKKLMDAGLGEPEIEEMNDDNVAAGQVISASIESGEKIPEGTVVKLVISKGPKPFAMPRVEGNNLAAAKETLEKAGLVVNVEYQNSDKIAQGNVISQSVAAGSDMKKGASVTLTVSSGKAVELITVANVVGQTQASAKGTLEGQGFYVSPVENYSDSVASGNVINQNPSAGSSQIKGTTITIYVSKGKQPVTTVSVTGVSLNNTSLSLEVGQSGQLSATVSPSNATNKSVNWSSSKTDVATVDSNGKITAKTEGNATITATTADGNKTASCTVTVKKPAPTTVGVTGVTLNNTSLSLEVGQSGQLSATVSPDNASNKAVSWGSSDSNVATVDSNGVVTAKSAGNATITVTTADGNKTATCSIKVMNPAPTTISVTGVSISNTSLTLNMGQSGSLNATVIPDNASNKAVSWSSDNPGVASVDSNGNVSAKAPGTANIKVTTSDGAKTATCKVTVNSVNYTYQIQYVSSNGTNLGSSSATNAYGTTNTISAPAKSGYNTPAAQNVAWDSSSKTITFTYSPTAVAATTVSKRWMTNPNADYIAVIEHGSRTATSVQIRVTLTLKFASSSGWCNYGQSFVASSGSASTGAVWICGYKGWPKGGSVAATSGWMTVPLSTTNATSITVSIYNYQTNSPGENATQRYGAAGGTSNYTVQIPAY